MTNDSGTPSYVGDELVRNANLWAALGENLPDFALIKRLVSEAYVAETGNTVTDDALASWMRRAIQENPNFHGLRVDDKIPKYVMFPDIASKIWYLMMRPCHLCLPYQRVDFIRIMLHTPPISRQVRKSRAFKRAIQNYLGRARHDFTDFYDARLCVAITFVFGTQARSSDMDNLAKILLDALQGYAYRNDEQIDHLDLIRSRTATADSFIGVRIAVTGIGENLDTIRPEFEVRWVPTQGVGPIDLTPYM